MRFLTAVLLASALLLPGCYESNQLLLDTGAARQPISTYQDWTYGSGDNRYHAQLNPRSDGWYDYSETEVESDGGQGTWEHHTVLLNYLESANGADVYAYGTYDDREKAYVYGLVVVRGNGRWVSLRPNCDSVDSNDDATLAVDIAAARQAGASTATNDGGTEICEFTSNYSLMAALRAIVDGSGFWNRVAEADSRI